jgi:hypothetical protein
MGWLNRKLTVVTLKHQRKRDGSIDGAHVSKPMHEPDWPKLEDERGEWEDRQTPEDEPERGETGLAFAHFRRVDRLRQRGDGDGGRDLKSWQDAGNAFRWGSMVCQMTAPFQHQITTNYIIRRANHG